MKEKTSLILGEVGSVKVLNEKKQEVFTTAENIKVGKLKLGDILAKQQECNNFVDIKIKKAERDFTEFKEKTNKEIKELQNEVLELKRVLTELVNFAVEG